MIFRRTRYMSLPAPERYTRPSDDRPPRPPVSASRAQWGIHDARFDPTGAPPMACASSKSGEST